jgi:hypothetical protein
VASSNGYSFINACAAEVKTAPLRFLLTTVPVFISMTTYLWSEWAPEKSYLITTPVFVQKDTSGKYSGTLQLATYSAIPLTSIKGDIKGYATNNSIVYADKTSLRPESGQLESMQVVISTQILPDYFVICMETKNSRRGISTQIFKLSGDNAALTASMSASVGRFYRPVAVQDTDNRSCD